MAATYHTDAREATIVTRSSFENWVRGAQIGDKAVYYSYDAGDAEEVVSFKHKPVKYGYSPLSAARDYDRSLVTENLAYAAAKAYEDGHVFLFQQRKDGIVKYIAIRYPRVKQANSMNSKYSPAARITDYA